MLTNEIYSLKAPLIEHVKMQPTGLPIIGRAIKNEKFTFNLESRVIALVYEGESEVRSFHAVEGWEKDLPGQGVDYRHRKRAQTASPDNECVVSREVWPLL